MIRQDAQNLKLPDTPGVYFFKKNKKILYVGKASSLSDRVKSYFSNTLLDGRGPRIVKMVTEADSISYERTDSVLEALILEAQYIKELKPIYNSLDKDDKSFNHVIITDEKWPRVLLIRGKELKLGLPAQIAKRFVAGPFPHGSQLKEALKIIRKIFPFRDEKCIPYEVQKQKFDKRRPLARLTFRPVGCFNRQIGLCPGVCTGEITHAEYLKIIRNIILFFQGKKGQVVRNLERQMKAHVRLHEFEKAEEIKHKIFALNHIRDVSLLKIQQLTTNNQQPFRIEAYDISHISGKETVGVMVVMEDGELLKSGYRKFSARGGSAFDGKTLLGNNKPNDPGALAEIIKRRLNHVEWSLPNLIVVDGGKAQLNAAGDVVKDRRLNIAIVSVVKDQRHKAREIIGHKTTIEKHRQNILLNNSEAHRFAVAFHRKRRGKNIFK